MKTKQYLAFIIAFGAFSSCTSLTETPNGTLTSQQFYKTESDAIQATNATYFLLNSGGSTVQTPYNTLFSTGMDMMTDDVDPGPGATNPDVRSQSILAHSSSGLRVLQIWQQLYAGVEKANVALDNIPGISFDPTRKSQALGENQFLRALYYFNLVRLYGDVPLQIHQTSSLSPSALNVPRIPAAQVYAQIESDLIQASDVLPNSWSGADLGRATKGAALALLAKVYLTENKWQQAVTTSLQVITSGHVPGATGTFGYDLFPIYSHVFLPAYKNGIEHVFSAQFQSNSLGQGNNQAPRAARKGVPGIPSGSYADQVRFGKYDPVSGALLDKYFSVFRLYTANDQRKAGFQLHFLGSDGKLYGDKNNPNLPGDSVPYFAKSWDPNQQQNLSQSAANVAIIRYAEVLLNHAEAENELNGPDAAAYASINKIRARAGLQPLTPGLSQTAFRDSVYLDRRLELVWEYQRWFDLIREKDSQNAGQVILKRALLTVGKTNVQIPKHLLFPIPLQEIQNNPNLTQNPGW